MKLLKEYNILYDLHRRRATKLKMLTFMCLLIFFLAFATMFLRDFPFELQLVMLGMIFPAAPLGTLWLISSVRTRKFLKAFSPQQLAIINREAASCEKCEKMFVTSQAVVAARFGLEFVRMENVLWVYTYFTTQDLWGVVPIWKDTFMVIAGKDHKMHNFRIKNTQDAYDFIQTELLKHRLDIVFGDEPGLGDIYKHDIQRMIDFSLECAEKRKNWREYYHEHELSEHITEN